jgi:hypothetical protein
MPSTSKKQHNFMNAVAHSPEFAKKAGVPQSVGKEFSNADKSRKFSKGGDMKNEMMSKLKAHAAKPASKAHKGLAKGGSVGTTKMGAVKTGSKPDGVAMKGKTKGTMVKMARGGKTC